jgi:hypothetical protein
MLTKILNTLIIGQYGGDVGLAITHAVGLTERYTSVSRIGEPDDCSGTCLSKIKRNLHWNHMLVRPIKY